MLKCRYRRNPASPVYPLTSVPLRHHPYPMGNCGISPKSTVGRVEVKETIPFAIHSAIVDALDHAKSKHPHFADSNAEAGTVIAEELLEVNTAALKVMQSINDQASRDNLFVELAQLNATTIRMMERLIK